MSQEATDVNIKYIREDIQRIEKMIEEHIKTHVVRLEKLEDRINNIEKWKIAFVAKFSVYSSIAIFLGTLIAQTAISLLTK